MIFVESEVCFSVGDVEMDCRICNAELQNACLKSTGLHKKASFVVK